MSRHDASTEQEPLLRADSASKVHNAGPVDSSPDEESIESLSIWQRFSNYEGKLKVAAVSLCFLVTGLNATDVGVSLPIIVQMPTLMTIRHY